jgi:hypothetical protein
MRLCAATEYSNSCRIALSVLHASVLRYASEHQLEVASFSFDSLTKVDTLQFDSQEITTYGDTDTPVR